MHVYETLGAWIKDRRKDLEFSQHDLAKRIGYSISTIRKIEIGLLRPSRAATNLLIECLEIPPVEMAQFVQLARTSPSPPSTLPSSAKSPQIAPILPLPPSIPIIDREREIGFLLQYLQHATTRLFTLVGPPGVGKTRLAVHLTTALSDLFGQSIAFVSLELLNDARLVLPLIAQTICQGDSLSAIKVALGSKPFLLILDNFEHVLPATHDLAQLLTTCPHLTILVTSRIVLNLSGEQQIPIAPLRCPPLNPLPRWQRLASYSAVQFFITCVQQIAPDFTLTRENAAEIATLCTRLEGLPLALQMAAARSNDLAPTQLLGQINQLLGQTYTKLDGSTQQHTLREAIIWSYRLLSGEEQLLFRQLSVWVGGCTLEAIEAVCADISGGRVEVVEWLVALLDKSMLQHHALDSGASPRFMMLAVLREFAREQVERLEEQASLQASHASYYLDLVLEAQRAFRGPQERDWIDRLELEHGNVRAALEWSKLHSPLTLVQLCGALVRFWFLQGHFREGRAWLEAAFSHSATTTLELHANVLHGMGVLAYAQSDCAIAIEHLEASLAIRRQINDDAGIFNALNYLGNTASSQHRIDQALRYYQEALAIAKARNDLMMQATLLLNIGTVYYYEADFTLAQRYFTECHALHQQINNAFGRGIVMNNLGLIAYQTGTMEQAAEFFNQSRTIAQEINNPLLLAESFMNLARVTIINGDLVNARELLKETTALREAHADRYAVAMTLEVWAELALAEDQPDRAVRLVAMSHALFNDVSTTVTPLAQRQRDTIEAAAIPRLSPEVDLASLATIEPQLPLPTVFAYVLRR